MTTINPRGPSATGRLLCEVVLEFPEYRIWRVTTFNRTQFIARAVSLRSTLHTLVTTSLDELAGELASARAASMARTLT